MSEEGGLSVAMEQEKLKESAQPAELEVCVPGQDLPEQEDHISHRREPLPKHPDTGIECTTMQCIICRMHIKRIIEYTRFNSSNENKGFMYNK